MNQDIELELEFEIRNNKNYEIEVIIDNVIYGQETIIFLILRNIYIS